MVDERRNRLQQNMEYEDLYTERNEKSKVEGMIECVALLRCDGTR